MRRTTVYKSVASDNNQLKQCSAVWIGDYILDVPGNMDKIADDSPVLDITPDMVKAGIDRLTYFYADYDSLFTREECVRDVFEAMLSASSRKLDPKGYHSK